MGKCVGILDAFWLRVTIKAAIQLKLFNIGLVYPLFGS